MEQSPRDCNENVKHFSGTNEVEGSQLKTPPTKEGYTQRFTTPVRQKRKDPHENRQTDSSSGSLHDETDYGQRVELFERDGTTTSETPFFSGKDYPQNHPLSWTGGGWVRVTCCGTTKDTLYQMGERSSWSCSRTGHLDSENHGPGVFVCPVRKGRLVFPSSLVLLYTPSMLPNPLEFFKITVTKMSDTIYNYLMKENYNIRKRNECTFLFLHFVVHRRFLFF